MFYFFYKTIASVAKEVREDIVSRAHINPDNNIKPLVLSSTVDFITATLLIYIEMLLSWLPVQTASFFLFVHGIFLLKCQNKCLPKCVHHNRVNNFVQRKILNMVFPFNFKI